MAEYTEAELTALVMRFNDDEIGATFGHMSIEEARALAAEIPGPFNWLRREFEQLFVSNEALISAIKKYGPNVTTWWWLEPQVLDPIARYFTELVAASDPSRPSRELAAAKDAALRSARPGSKDAKIMAMLGLDGELDFEAGLRAQKFAFPPYAMMIITSFSSDPSTRTVTNLDWIPIINPISVDRMYIWPRWNADVITEQLVQVAALITSFSDRSKPKLFEIYFVRCNDPCPAPDPGPWSEISKPWKLPCEPELSGIDAPMHDYKGGRMPHVSPRLMDYIKSGPYGKEILSSAVRKLEARESPEVPIHWPDVVFQAIEDISRLADEWVELSD